MSRAGSDTGYYSNAYYEVVQKQQSVVVPPAVPSPTANLQERQAPHVRRPRFYRSGASFLCGVWAQVAPPAAHIPSDEEFYVLDPHSGRHRPNVDLLRRHFFHEGRISQEHALYILEQTTDLMTREPNLLQVPSPVTGASPCQLMLSRNPKPTRPIGMRTVCGDIHGQYVRTHTSHISLLA